MDFIKEEFKSGTIRLSWFILNIENDRGIHFSLLDLESLVKNILIIGFEFHKFPTHSKMSFIEEDE